MDKKKHTSQQWTKWRIINALLILAIIGLSTSLIMNYIMPVRTMSVAGTWVGIITNKPHRKILT